MCLPAFANAVVYENLIIHNWKTQFENKFIEHFQIDSDIYESETFGTWFAVRRLWDSSSQHKTTTNICKNRRFSMEFAVCIRLGVT